MEYSQINTVTKFGPDDYSLWTLTMPRDQIHQIRQGTPSIEGDVRRVFDEIRIGEDQPESICNFVFPQSDGLKLFSVDMGTGFTERNRHNGTSIRGSREEIIAELREVLKGQGYSLHGNASFLNVDVLETLRKIMEHNTDYYQTDFQYDVDMLREAAGDRNAGRNFFWMSRGSGTWCFRERDIYIRNTNAHNTWNYYGGGNKSEHVKTYWVELNGVRDDKVLGNITEMDYQKHLDYLCMHSFDPASAEVVFKNPNGCRTFSYPEYNQNYQSIAQRYGTVERVKYLVEDQDQFARAVISAHGLFWEATEPMEIDAYVKLLDHDRLHNHGYTADDLVLTGPLDAEVAVKNGLACYALCTNGSKELLADKDDYQKHQFNGCLFGMGAEERTILQYFKQNCTPLFSTEEMREICSLALRAGMENDPGRAGLLDGIIHKAECMLPKESEESALERENEYNREE